MWTTSAQDRLHKLRLDQREGERERVVDQPVVDELGGLARQVVLVVREVEDRPGGPALLREPVRVDAAGSRPRLELVPFEQAEGARGLDGPSEQRVGRREDLE